MTTIKQNFFYNIIYQIFTVLMPMVSAPYLSRVIGATGVGMYSYTFTVAEYFAYFALLGVANYGNRTIAGVRPEKRSQVFVNIYAVQFSMSMLVIAIYIVFAVFINTRYKVLTYIQLLYILSAALDVTWYFFGTEKFRLTTIRNCFIKLLCLVCIFLFVKTPNDTWIYTLIMAASYLLSQVIMWVYVFREIKFERLSLADMKVHLKYMFILFLPVIAITIYKMMDKLMLEWMSSVENVGLYESAEKIVRVPALIITALGTSMLPRMSKLSALGEKHKMLEYFEISIEFVGFLTFGMCFGLVSIASFLIPIYYGEGFKGSIILLELLSLTLPFTSWANAIRTQYLLPLKHDTEYLLSVSIGAVVNLVLNTILIASMAAKGAVIATIAAEASVAIVQTYSVRKEIPIINLIKKYGIYILPALGMFVALQILQSYLKPSLIGLSILLINGVLIYLLLAGLIMIINKSKLLEVGKNIFTMQLKKK